LIEPWGKNSLRICATKKANIDTDNDWALLKPKKSKYRGSTEVKISISRDSAAIKNGKIKAKINKNGGMHLTQPIPMGCGFISLQ